MTNTLNLVFLCFMFTVFFHLYILTHVSHLSLNQLSVFKIHKSLLTSDWLHFPHSHCDETLNPPNILMITPFTGLYTVSTALYTVGTVQSPPLTTYHAHAKFVILLLLTQPSAYHFHHSNEVTPKSTIVSSYLPYLSE